MPKGPITTLTDNWVVVQLANDNGELVDDEDSTDTRALIIKQSPIAVQKYKDGGSEARYAGSDIEASVVGWQVQLDSNDVKINGQSLRNFMLPVILNGANQSNAGHPPSYRGDAWWALIGRMIGLIGRMNGMHLFY
jgi:hypothetical protein